MKTYSEVHSNMYSAGLWSLSCLILDL